MRKIIPFLVAVLVVGMAAPVGATPPAGVEFVAVMGDASSGAAFGPFVATGSAVDDGLMCSSGLVTQQSGKASGFQSAKGYVNFQVVHRFTCDDESGDFLVKLQVRINQNGDNFQWNIVGGTGDYEDLHGSGKGFGLPDCGFGAVSPPARRRCRRCGNAHAAGGDAPTDHLGRAL